MQILECLFIAYNAAELWGSGFRHQDSPVFFTILSFLNISDTLLVQLISMLIAASTYKLEGLQTDVCQIYTEHLFL